MLSINDLKSGTYFILDGQPFEILKEQHVKLHRRKAFLQTKIKNLVNGKIIERNFQQSDAFKKANISKQEVKYLYNHKEEYWFSEKNDAGKRFKLNKDLLGSVTKFLKSNTVLEALVYDDEIINVSLPVKMNFKVTEAPPEIKGGTAVGGTKPATIETGVKINVPFFINEGDVIKINTQTGQYAERVEKK